MVDHEVWSFIYIFYNLCNTGKNPSLLLKSQDCIVVINLQLDLDVPIPPPPQPPNKNHPSPSRVRRTQHRARARAEAAAENATRASSNNMVVAVEAATPPSPTYTAVQGDIVTEEITDIAVQANYDKRCPKDITEDTAAKVVQAEVDSEEVDTSEEIDINYNVKVFNLFSPLQIKKELDEPALTDRLSSPRQPSLHSSSSAQPSSPQRTPGTSRNPDFDMSFNLDSKFENMELQD